MKRKHGSARVKNVLRDLHGMGLIEIVGFRDGQPVYAVTDGGSWEATEAKLRDAQRRRAGQLHSLN
jgi:hypothetical protein